MLVSHLSLGHRHSGLQWVGVHLRGAGCHTSTFAGATCVSAVDLTSQAAPRGLREAVIAAHLDTGLWIVQAAVRLRCTNELINEEARFCFRSHNYFSYSVGIFSYISSL